ncbi:hypothetical protein EON65_15300 [archaeon]|nr:MAG: hypothetical protein EON65_15300 [archaeon]
MIRVTQANPTTYFVLFFKKDSTMKGSKDAIGALVTISKMSVEVAKEIPVIGDMIKPLAAICEQVINICQEIKACHDTFQKLQDRIEHVCELLLKKPDGLILVLKSRPELHNTVKTSIDRLIGKYDLIRRQLLPFQNSKTFFRFFVSNASNIKKTLEEKDAEIARELERLSVDLQVANLKLQVQTFDIVTDLQDKITNKFGGQQGLLHNEAALEEVAQSIGMDLEDVRVSVRDYLEEMGQKLKEHFTYESERVKQFNSGKLEEIYQSIKELGSKFDAAQNGKTSVSQNTTFLMALDQIALRDSLYMDSSIELGNGTFANIHPGRYQGKDVAVKVVKMKIIRESEATAVQDMVREILVHHKLSVVPGIVELLGVVPGDPNEPPKVVLELAEGKLFVFCMRFIGLLFRRREYS